MNSVDKITVYKNVEIEMPHTPNFLRLADKSVIPVEDLSCEDLEKVGKEWTRLLIEKAMILKNKRG